MVTFESYVQLPDTTGGQKLVETWWKKVALSPYKNMIEHMGYYPLVN